MLKNYRTAIISLALSFVFGIFAYWYLNYYLIQMTYNPDGTGTGFIKEMTLTRSWILIGSILLSFSSFVLFLYHTVKTLMRTNSNKTESQLNTGFSQAVDRHIKMTEVDDNEIARRIRQRLIDVLDLWTSMDDQLEYQEKAAIAHISHELFNQWDDWYRPETVHFKLAFDENEREILVDFDKVLNHISDKTPPVLPNITEFVKTNDWLVVNQAAINTLKSIKNTAANSS